MKVLLTNACLVFSAEKQMQVAKNENSKGKYSFKKKLYALVKRIISLDFLFWDN